MGFSQRIFFFASIDLIIKSLCVLFSVAIYIASILFEDSNGDKIEFSDSNPLLIQNVQIHQSNFFQLGISYKQATILKQVIF